MGKRLVFSPIPYALTEVPLGSLVTDILRPHRSVQVIKPAALADFKTSDQEAFNGVLKSDVANGFFAQLTRLLHLSRDTSSNVSLHVTADQGKEHWLKEPERFWEDMLTNKATKDTASTFLSGLYTRGEAWFVTATRTFIDATVEIENGKGSEWKIEAEVPAGKIATAAGGMSAGDDGHAGDIGGGATRTWKTGANEKFLVKGERIFSIEFRKVMVKKCKKGVSAEPENGFVIRTLPDFRGGRDTGADMTGEETYVVRLDNHGETLETYDDELGELEESGKVNIISDDEDGSVVYINPKWVEYMEPERVPDQDTAAQST